MKDSLIIRLKYGDRQAYELIFRKYYVRLCGFANKFLNDPDKAKDVVQDVFIKLWLGRNEIDPEGSLKAFLFRITQNMSLNVLRHKKIESGYSEIYKVVYIDNADYSVYESLFTKEMEHSIEVAVKKMPPSCKRVYEMSRNEGLKNKEIAEKLNISLKTVEAHMSQALKTLRCELIDYTGFVLVFLLSVFCF